VAIQTGTPLAFQNIRKAYACYQLAKNTNARASKGIDRISKTSDFQVGLIEDCY
jgi:hypothetical protein